MKAFQFSKTVLCLSLLLGTGIFTNSYAQGYIMSFEVRGFAPSSGSLPPTDPVRGTIVWEAPGIDGPIERFVSVDLTLDGHRYAASDLGSFSHTFDPPWTDGIGGLLNDPRGVGSMTDDFFILWERGSLRPFGFTYASSRATGIWELYEVYNPGCFTSFSITPIPEPSLGSLFSVAMAGICIRHGLRRRNSI